jgi:hypothetical protein
VAASSALAVIVDIGIIENIIINAKKTDKNLFTLFIFFPPKAIILYSI